VGHALVGIRLLKCETPFGPTAEYCGAEALFRRIHNDGTVEANLLSVRIPQNLDYFGPTSTWVSPQPERPDLTARCPDTDHVVTAIRYWQRPEIGGRGEGAVTGIEITCSHITR
jgi:hypothetical protein